MKLLVALLERPGTLILREELHSLLWPDGTFVDFDHGLNAAATRLRQTLGDAAETPRFIESVPRRGYRFIAPVERVECGAKTFTTQPSQQTVIPPAVDRTSAGEAGMQATSTLSSTPTNRSRFVRLAWGGAIALLLCVGIVMFLRFRERPSVERQVSFTLLPPNATRFADFDTIAVSPDGQMLAFTATSSSGEQQLWVRALDSSQSRRLSDTAGASFPFWSSDSKSIGFFMNGKLKRVEASGGSPQSVCDAPNGRGGTWSASGTIVFAPAPASPLFEVPAAGGVPKPATNLDSMRNEITHRWPSFLPDGKHFLFMARSARAENSGIYIGLLGSGRTTLLVRELSNATLTRSPHGHAYLVFGRGDSLMRQRFDVRTNTLVGEPVPIADSVTHTLYTEPLRTAFSASEHAVLAYISGRPSDQLTWFERSGARTGMLGELGTHLGPIISPDGKEVIVATRDTRNGVFGLWRIDAAQGRQSQLTFNASDNNSPVWSPDGAQVVFAGNGEGNFNLYRMPATGAGDQETLLKSNRWKFPTDWSPDGRYLLYYEISPLKGRDIWALPLFGDRNPIPLAHTDHNERDARFSPDGKWLVYSSDESGKDEVYVQPFRPAAVSAGKWMISEGGGAHPQWPRPGNEIYYLAPDHRIMAVQVRTNSALEFDTPRPLFDSGIVDDSRTGFAVSTGGKRLLIPTAVGHQGSPVATVIVNWMNRAED